MSKTPFVVAVSGVFDILGAALIQTLQQDVQEIEGRPIEVVQIVRGQGLRGDAASKGKTVVIAPEWTQSELDPLECCDVIIHLTGESGAEVSASEHYQSMGSWVGLKDDLGSWTDDKKEEALMKQVKFTQQVVDAVKQLRVPPKMFICASEITYYQGSSSSLTEENDCGESFLARIGAARESAAASLEPMCRVVYLRFGLILSGRVGFISRLINLFRQGKSGYLGRGTQCHSFISLSDAVRGVLFLLNAGPELKGPINMTAPEPVVDSVMMKSLYELTDPKANFNPTPLSADQLRNVLGELSEDAFLVGYHVKPSRLLSLGFEFFHPNAYSALRWCVEADTPIPQSVMMLESFQLPKTPSQSLVTVTQQSSIQYNDTGSYPPTPAPSLQSNASSPTIMAFPQLEF